MDGEPQKEGKQAEKARLKPFVDKTVLKFLTTKEFSRGHTKTYRLQDAISETYRDYVQHHPKQTHLQIHNSILSDYPNFPIQSLEQVEGNNDDNLSFELFCGRANLFIIEQALKEPDNFETEDLFTTFTNEASHREAKFRHEEEGNGD